MFLENVAGAAGALFDLKTLMLMFIGVSAGLIAGSIPGFTIVMGVVLVLPFTFGLTAVEGLATMMGVLVGGLSGGLLSGILTGIPGTPSSVATTFDGFPMARNGQPGLALGIGVWSSFFGGIIGAVLLAILAPQLARIGLEFQPWDFFALIVFALTITASLAGRSMLKGCISGVLGLLIVCIGEDDINSVARFTFGVPALASGFAFLPVLIGLFAFSQLLNDVRDRHKARAPMMQGVDPKAIAIEHLTAIAVIMRNSVNLVRSAVLGTFIGVLPAAGTTVSNIIAYDQAKKASKTPEKFGTGTPEGIVASEGANNATMGGALVTMMALGIPGDTVTAVMIGALLIHNVVPSPAFIQEAPVLAYSIIGSFFVCHFIMIILQAFCLKGFVHVTRVPMYRLVSIILVYCAIGVFALNNVLSDLWILLAFGVLGFSMRAFGFPLAPMVLGVVLGPIAELYLARSLSLNSDISLFFTRPWALFFLILAAFSVVFPWYQNARGKERWTLIFMPALGMSLAGPLSMMGGVVRPFLAALLFAVSAYGLWRNLATSGKLGKAEES
jgi:putative tricarboxylic transport membrane protein